MQGARHAGARHIVAVDPVEFKRAKALEWGATHTAADGAEALGIVTELTRGVGAEAAILSPGLTTAQVRRGSVGHQQGRDRGGGGPQPVRRDVGAGVSGRDRPVAQDHQGSLFGDCNPTTDIPRLLDLYRSGHLEVDALLTRTYPLEQINEGYDDMMAGRNIRGVIAHQH